MNRNENRNKIATAVELCFYQLEKYNRAHNDYAEELRKIDASPYNQMMQGNMRKTAEEAFCAQAKAVYDEMHNQFEVMRIAAREMAATLDIGDEFQNTLATVSALGENLPAEVRRALIQPFKGEMHMLQLLKSSFATSGLSTAYFDELIRDPDKTIDDLDDAALALVMQPGDGVMRMLDVGKSLEKFAANEGAELKHKLSDIVDTSNALNAYLRAAAGLGTAD